MLLFSIGETRVLAGDVMDESDFTSTLSTLPAGVRSYLSQGKSLALRKDRLAAVRLLLSLLEKQGFCSGARILRDEWGRPYFDDPTLPDFNLSHSDGFVAVALGDGRVGIDLQGVNSDFDPVPLAERFFAKDEAAIIRSAPKEDRTDLFFALWTKKEAHGKALGKGLADTLGKHVATVPRCTTEKRAIGGKLFFLSVCGNGTPVEINE